MKRGRKRNAVINGCKMADAGKIEGRTNADQGECALGVKCK